MVKIELLKSLGMPTAFVALVIIAAIFRKSHPKVSIAAAVMSVALIGTFAIVQIGDHISRRDIALKVSPDDFYAFTADGPTSLNIKAIEGNTTIVENNITKPSAERFKDRLEDLGWNPAINPGSSSNSNPAFWQTNRVFVGQTIRLGRTKYGLLSIRAERFLATGEAVVRLILKSHDEPEPEEIRIKNKAVATQSFKEAADFYVAVREADFQTNKPWAQFCVFVTK